MKTLVLNSGGVASLDAALIQDEMEMVQSLYPDATVHFSPTCGGMPTISVDLPIQWKGSCTATKATLHVVLVYGYPFVLPNISVDIHEPSSTQRRPTTAPLVDVEAIVQSRLPRGVRDATTAAVSTGQPCLLQLLAHVEEFFSQEPTPVDGNDGGAGGLQGNQPSTAASKKSVAFNTAPESPAVDDQAFKSHQKQLRRLAALTLHLTEKCCELYSKESDEEAQDSFSFLKQYLADEVGIVPKEISDRWDARKMLQAGFASFVEKSESDDVRLCLKWFWGTHAEERRCNVGTVQSAAFTFDQRFAHDFIQQRRIGAGGFAPVFVCRKIIDGKLYAVKKIVVRTHQSARALREVQMLAALDHENIVRYYDAWAEPGIDRDLESFVEEMEEDEEEEDDDEETEEDSDAEVSEEEDDASDMSSSSTASLHLPPPTRKDNAVEYRSAAASFLDSDDDDDTSETGDGCSLISTPALGSSSAPTTATSTSRQSKDVRIDVNDGGGHHPLFGGGPLERGRQLQTSNDRYRTLYIQMELCQASTLRHLIDSGRLEEERGGEALAASIFRQLLMVVAHVHSEQVVHRDLKPDNVLFQQQQIMNPPSRPGASSPSPETLIGAIKVADFGLARSMPKSLLRSRSADMDDLTNTEGGVSPISSGGGTFQDNSNDDNMVPPHIQVTTNCGTVLYCAPEQADGSSYDSKVDDYSVGMIALEMWLAVAGKDFRERFITLNQVTRSQGVLPIWFQQWRPKIAEIISSLIRANPRKRSTCESILTRQDLPGEPAEVAQALHTFAQYGPKMIGRVFQRLEEHATANFRRRAVTPASTDALKHIPLQVQRLLETCAVLHCATPLPFVESMLPLAPPLRAMLSTPGNASIGNTLLMDDAGKCFLYSAFPQLSAASYLSSHRASFHEDSFTFYYNKSGRPSFNFGTLHTSTVMDVMLQPVMYALDVLSGLEISEGARIVITLFAPIERSQSSMSFEEDSSLGTAAPIAAVCAASAERASQQQRNRHRIESHEHLRDYLDHHAQEFSVDDAHQIRFIVGVLFSAMPHLFRSTADMPLIFVSSEWHLDDDAPVDASMLGGVVMSVEVMTGNASPGTNASAASNGRPHSSGKHMEPPARGTPSGAKRRGQEHGGTTAALEVCGNTTTCPSVTSGSGVTTSGCSTTLVAVACHLQRFASLFNPYHDTLAFMVSFDIAAIQSVSRRVVRNLLSSSTVLDGIVISTGDGAPNSNGNGEGGGGGGGPSAVVATSTCGGGANPGNHIDAAAPLMPLSSSSSTAGSGVTSEVVVLLAKLWSAGHRVYPRRKISNKELTTFKEGSSYRQHSWWMTEALKLLWIPSVLSTKTSRHDVRHEVHNETLIQDIRSIMMAASPSVNGGTVHASSGTAIGPAAASSSHTSSTCVSTYSAVKVEFTCREDSNAVHEARECLSHLLAHTHHSSIIAVLCTSSEVRRCFSEFMDAYERASSAGGASTLDGPSSALVSPGLAPRCSGGAGVQAFMDWLRKHFFASTMCMIPVFCLPDKRMELLVHPQRLKQAIRGKAEAGRRGGGGHSHSKKGGKHNL